MERLNACFSMFYGDVLNNHGNEDYYHISCNKHRNDCMGGNGTRNPLNETNSL